jgi:hypothetical protein
VKPVSVAMVADLLTGATLEDRLAHLRAEGLAD